MEAITPLNIEQIKEKLQHYLRQQLGEEIPCQVTVKIDGDQLLVFIRGNQSFFRDYKSLVEAFIESFCSGFDLSFKALKFYWLIEGGVYTLKGDRSSSLVPYTHSKGGTEPIDSTEKTRHKRIYLGLTGMGLGMTLGLGLLYGITRPCVMGSCPQLELLQEQFNILKTQIPLINSEIELEQLRPELSKIITFSGSIPPWSSYYSQAQELYHFSEPQLRYIETLIQKKEKIQGTKEIINSESQPIEKWKQAQAELQEITNSIPPVNSSDPLSNFVEIQRRQYQGYLSQIEQRLQSEIGGNQRLKEGIEAGKLAIYRQNIAQDLEDWQLVLATWKTAIERLQSIPNNTTASQEGRQFLDEYRSEFTKALGKKQREELAHQNHQNALQKAQKAEEWQKQNQWSLAVQDWRNALAELRKIPPSSFYYQTVQPIISTYQVSLNLAQSQLRNAIKTQEIETYLKQVCERPQKICSYQLEKTLIKVTLTPEYHEQIMKTAKTAQLPENQAKKLNLLDHISRLEKGLQTLSVHTQKPVELYHSDGRLMMTFQMDNLK